MNALIIIFLLTYGVWALFNNYKFWVIYLLITLLYFYLTQIKFFNNFFNSVRRKVMIASWGESNNPIIYAKVNLDVTKIESYLEEKSKEIGEKITLTIYTIKLISMVLKKYPEITGYIKFGKYVPREDIDIACLVDVGGGEELANLIVRKADTKTFETILREVRESSQKLRKKQNKEQNQKNLIFGKMPTFIMAPMVFVISWISSIGFSCLPLGLKKQEFGCCVVTSIGSLGIEDAYTPLPGVSFNSFCLSICKKKVKYYFDEKLNVNERVTVGLNFTIDSRFINPKDAIGFNYDLKLIGENPELFEKEMQNLIVTLDEGKKLN